MSEFPPNKELFFAQVWEIVEQIPPGAVSTYGQIASMLPPPLGVTPDNFERLAPRWVGKAMNAVSPQPQARVPWQRVINSQGGISLPQGSAEAAEQRKRLLAEGVRFNNKGLVDLQVYGWDGPSLDWLRAHGFFSPRPLRQVGGSSPEQLSLF